MKKLEIEIPEGYEIDVENSDIKTGKIQFKKIEPMYPIDISKVKNRHYYISDSGKIVEHTIFDHKNQVSTKERAEALLALSQLVELRDAYNKIDGYCPKKQHVLFYIKINAKNEIEEGIYNIDWNKYVLFFLKPSTRDLFLENFKDLIERAKELL